MTGPLRPIQARLRWPPRADLPVECVYNFGGVLRGAPTPCQRWHRSRVENRLGLDIRQTHPDRRRFTRVWIGQELDLSDSGSQFVEYADRTAPTMRGH